MDLSKLTKGRSPLTAGCSVGCATYFVLGVTVAILVPASIRDTLLNICLIIGVITSIVVYRRRKQELSTESKIPQHVSADIARRPSADPPSESLIHLDSEPILPDADQAKLCSLLGQAADLSTIKDKMNLLNAVISLFEKRSGWWLPEHIDSFNRVSRSIFQSLPIRDLRRLDEILERPLPPLIHNAWREVLSTLSKTAREGVTTFANALIDKALRQRSLSDEERAALRHIVRSASKNEKTDRLLKTIFDHEIVQFKNDLVTQPKTFKEAETVVTKCIARLERIEQEARTLEYFGIDEIEEIADEALYDLVKNALLAEVDALAKKIDVERKATTELERELITYKLMREAEGKLRETPLSDILSKRAIGLDLSLERRNLIMEKVITEIAIELIGRLSQSDFDEAITFLNDRMDALKADLENISLSGEAKTWEIFVPRRIVQACLNALTSAERLSATSLINLRRLILSPALVDSRTLLLEKLGEFGFFEPVPDPCVVLKKNEESYFTTFAHVSKTVTRRSRARVYTGTRLKIGDLPIYLGGSIPAGGAREEIVELGEHRLVFTSRRFIVIGPKVTFSHPWTEPMDFIRVSHDTFQVNYGGRYSGHRYRTSNLGKIDQLVRGLRTRAAFVEE